jgi:hypothetical protein
MESAPFSQPALRKQPPNLLEHLDGQQANLHKSEDVTPFAVPDLIALDLPNTLSERAKEVLGQTAAVCMSHICGTIAPTPDASLLAALTRGCSELNALLPTDIAHLTERQRVFDSFFRIRRSVSQDAFATGLAAAAIAASHELSRTNSLLPVENASLVCALHRIASEFVSVSGAGGISIRSPSAAPMLPQSFERWRNGHVLFVGLIDGAIYFHHKAINAIRERDDAAANLALRDLSCIFHGSAAALRLAGDVTPAEYDEIRVYMGPPNLPGGFSGLWNADHSFLLQLIKQLGSAIRLAHPSIAAAREEYLLSINAAYAAHRYVCQKAVGQAASLATQSAAVEQPGHETLRQFAKRTIEWATRDQRRSDDE